MNKLYDENLHFDEPTHVYSLKNDPEIDFISATTFIHGFFSPFDREKVANKLLGLPKYAGSTKEELFAEWKQSGISGTNVHAALENLILEHNSAGFPMEATENSYDFVEVRNSNLKNHCHTDTERNKASKGMDWLKDNVLFEPELQILPEVMVYSKELQMAGMMDLLVKNTVTGNYTILDWKTNKRISKTSFGNTKGSKPATEEIDDCNFMHYTLQLSLYRYILETYYGISISSQALIHLSDSKATVMKCEYLEDTIKNMIKEK